MLCGVFALLIKLIDFLTFSASPSSDQTAARGGGGGVGDCLAREL